MPLLPALSPQIRRSFDDAQGLTYGICSAAIGFVFLNAAGLLAGQTAGLAILTSHLTSLSFGQAFFLINLPFYIFGWMTQGKGVVLRTFFSVSMVAFLADAIPQFLTFAAIHPAVGALAYGVTAGLGLLGLIRHRSSLGGSGMLALYLQERFQIRAGRVLLIGDCVVFAIGLCLLPPMVMAYSFLGAVILNCVIFWNHIPGRYTA